MQRNDNLHFEPHQVGRKPGELVLFPVSRSLLSNNVLPLNIAQITQPLPECIVMETEP